MKLKFRLGTEHADVGFQPSLRRVVLFAWFSVALGSAVLRDAVRLLGRETEAGWCSVLGFRAFGVASKDPFSAVLPESSPSSHRT